jgi:hypothetical protein
MDKVTINISITYQFKGQFLEDYLGQLGDYEDTISQREWFAIDQLIGEEALSKLDKQHKLSVSFEEELPWTRYQ